jgi:peroxiredoxin
MKKKLTVAVLLATVLLGYLLLPVSGALAAGREGEILPFFKGVTTEGEKFDLKTFSRENTALIFFWNSYKTMSIREMTFLNEMQRYYHLYGLEIAAVEGTGKTGEEVKGELEKLAIIGTVPTYTVLSDPGGRLLTLFRVADIPETFLIDRAGRIIHHINGFRESDGAELERAIKERLGLLPGSAVTSPQPSPDKGTGRKEGENQKRGVPVDPEQQILEKHRYFGNYYYNLGQMEQALENYREYLLVDPDTVDIQLRIGEIYAKLNDYENARKAWENVLRMDPGNREADQLLRQLFRGEF